MMRPSVVRGITIAALFVASLAHMLGTSEKAAADEGVAADALAPGSWSVQFSVQPNFTLGSYSGSTLSLKRHLASGNALRLGLSVGFGTVGDDVADAHADTFTTRVQSSNIDGNAWSIGAGAYYLWYARRAAPLHAYWGVGPTISWSRGRNERTQLQTITGPGQPSNSFTSAEESKTRGWQIGVAGALGVEWLVARRVGLFAEYGSALAYAATKLTTSRTTTSTGSPGSTDRFERKVHRWDFSGSGGKLGVSVYY